MASVLAEYQARTQLLGDPEMGNCTLSINPVQSEDAMSYYVWINPDSVRHRFYDVTVRVEVADTPDPLMLSDPGVLIEGDQTTITCSVRHTCPSAPPSLGWSPGGGKAATRHERLAGGGWRAESELSYTPSYKDHGQLLQCTATFPQPAAGPQWPVPAGQVSPAGRGGGRGGAGPAEGRRQRHPAMHQPEPPSGHRVPLVPGAAPGPAARAGPGPRGDGAGRGAPLGALPLCRRERDRPGGGLARRAPRRGVPAGAAAMGELHGAGQRARGAATCHCAAEGNPPPRLEWRLPTAPSPGTSRAQSCGRLRGRGARS
ncbi:unnamed protein product [Natator depressus]